MTFETVAGSTLGCSVAVPSTYDEAGYGASSMVYTNIGEITDLGTGFGRAYNIVSHAPISSAQITEKKGGFKVGTVKMKMAWDQSDAGQDLCRAASVDYSILTFKLTKQSGDIRYFTAQVSEFTEDFGTVDKVVEGMLTLLLQKTIVYNPA